MDLLDYCKRFALGPQEFADNCSAQHHQDQVQYRYMQLAKLLTEWQTNVLRRFATVLLAERCIVCH
jgi:hypothetical protein